MGAETAAYTTSNAGKHTAELAFDSGFVGGPLQLWLGALNSLRQRRNPPLAIHLLNTEQVPRLAAGWRTLFDGTRSWIHIRIATVVRYGGRRGSFLARSSAMRSLRTLLQLVLCRR